MDEAVIAVAFLSALLVAGKMLRVRSAILQRLYLPASVIGGLLGLAMVTAAKCVCPAAYAAVLDAPLGVVRELPGFLIAFIFATLFLGVKTPELRTTFRLALPQLTLAQIVAWGQYVVGLGLVGFLLAPAFRVPDAFGNLLELGFEGGHGTVGGMAESFKRLGWPDGVALGYTVATVGMVLGIVVGMYLVNCAYKRGWVKTLRPFSARAAHERRGVYPCAARPEAGRQTVYADSVDSLAWHLAIAGVATFLGWLLLKGLQGAEAALFPAEGARLFKGFPLFPLCMVGGVLLQKTARACKIDLLVDRAQMERLAGAALDFLALAAISTIQISVVLAHWLPLAIMMAAGLCWTVFIVLWLAPKLFEEAWFERAVTEFGQATGVTATGLLLLRTVDPENKTVAASSFACKQLFHEPLMGVWVALALVLVFEVGWVPVFSISLAVVVFWSVVAYVLVRRRRRQT